MTKKKKIPNDTQDTYSLNQKVFGLPLQFVVSVLTVISLIIAGYITLSLAPLRQDIEILRSQAMARDKRIDTGFNHIDKELDKINASLVRIEDKLSK